MDLGRNKTEGEKTGDIDDRAYEVRAINSDRFETKEFASYKSQTPQPTAYEDQYCQI